MVPAQGSGNLEIGPVSAESPARIFCNAAGIVAQYCARFAGSRPARPGSWNCSQPLRQSRSRAWVLMFARRSIVDQHPPITAEEFNATLAWCQFLPVPNFVNLSVVAVTEPGRQFDQDPGRDVAVRCGRAMPPSRRCTASPWKFGTDDGRSGLPTRSRCPSCRQGVTCCRRARCNFCVVYSDRRAGLSCSRAHWCRCRSAWPRAA